MSVGSIGESYFAFAPALCCWIDANASLPITVAKIVMSTGHGFLSRLARRIVRGLVRFYYPNIEISGADRLPANGPLLLAANHQNSLMDPVMVGIVARRPVRFLAKAPLFQIPLFGNILHALGMLPAYRRADDPTQTRRNLESYLAAIPETQRTQRDMP